MNHKITPHEPEEELLSSVAEAFQDAEESQRRWDIWEQKHRMKSIRIEVPQAEYAVLQDLAQQQGKTVSQFIQTILLGVLPALLPPAQAHSLNLTFCLAMRKIKVLSAPKIKRTAACMLVKRIGFGAPRPYRNIYVAENNARNMNVALQVEHSIGKMSEA